MNYLEGWQRQTIADRITLQCHHDWIEAFLVSHREVRPVDQHQGTTG